METILLLGASVSQLPAIRRARAAGLRVVAVDGDREAVGLGEADVVEVVDFSEVDAVVEVGRRHAVDGVVAISTDRAVPVAAAVAERLGLPGIGTSVARAMTDKGAMRACLEEHGVPQPPFTVVESVEAATRAFARMGAPAVIKPVDSGGQRGLYRVETEADVLRSVPQALAYSRTRRVIVERYVEGDELNVIAAVRGSEVRVLTLSDRLRPPGVGFGVGWIHRFPSVLPPELLRLAETVAIDAVTALGLRDGVAFPQLLAADGEVLVAEVAARVPAGQMADLVYHGVGVDLIRIALEQALGRSVPDEAVTPLPPRPTVIRFFTAEPGPLPTGRLLAVDGLDLVRSSEGVLDADLYLEIGETIRPVQVDADRRGYVVTTGPDTAAALAAADAAMRKLSVETERIDVSSRL